MQREEQFSTFVPNISCRHTWRVLPKPEWDFPQYEDGIEQPMTHGEAWDTYQARLKKWNECHGRMEGCLDCAAMCVRDQSGRIVEYELFPFQEEEVRERPRKERRA